MISHFSCFGGTLPWSARSGTRPLQCCVLCFTRILHVLPQTGFFLQNPASHNSYIHLHSPFPIADSHARAPKTLILQVFTICFEVSLFQGWRCEKRRVSVLRRFCIQFLFGVMVFFRWGMEVQVGIFSMFYLMVALLVLLFSSVDIPN